MTSMNPKVADRITVDGVGLETRWIGPGPDEAPTIVMLHEGLGSAGLWRDWPERLAAATGAGVFLYSRGGYGASDPVPLPRPLSYMEDEALRVLPKVLDAIGFQRGVLLGHSDGASIAAIYAGGVEDFRVRGLVLFAPHFFVEDLSVASIEQARRDYETGDLKSRLARHHANVDVAFRGWNDAWLDPGFRSWDIRDSIGYIRVPMLIVQGVADRYGTRAQVDAAIEEAYCPVDVEWLEGVDHSPHLEAPVRTLAVTAEFIDTLFDTFGEGARDGR